MSEARNLPPFMTPFVLIADIDREVMEVTMVVVKISSIDSPENIVNAQVK